MSNKSDIDITLDFKINGFLQCLALEIPQDLFQFRYRRLFQYYHVSPACIQRLRAVRHAKSTLDITQEGPSHEPQIQFCLQVQSLSRQAASVVVLERDIKQSLHLGHSTLSASLT